MTKRTTVKVVPGKRDKYLLRWTKWNGKPGEKCTGLAVTLRNKTLAIKMAGEHEKNLASSPREITWVNFETRFKEEHLETLSDSSRNVWSAVSNYVDSIIAPARLDEFTSDALSRLVTGMRKTVPTETSIDTYMRTLMAALKWAYDLDMLVKMPRYRKLRRASKTTKKKPMRGRPLKLEEVERLQAAARKVRPNDFELWQDYIEGLSLSGLRLGESIIASFNPRSDFWLDLDCDVPQYRIRQEGQKSNREEVLPIAPDFVDFLSKRHKKGPVFRLPCKSVNRVSRIVSSIGKKAGVIVDHKKQKHATAHDLRRTFGSRWAEMLSTQDLQLMMRHDSIETTMRYYVNMDAAKLGKRVQAAYQSMHRESGQSEVESLVRLLVEQIGTESAITLIRAAA